jgi:hypothetical protein
MVEHATPLQIDLFTGTLVDTRTPAQKKAQAEQQQPRQIEMFSQHETAQFGVNAHPVMPLSPGKLVLIQEDLRTDEEIEQDLMRQAQSNTPDLFALSPAAQVKVDPLSVVSQVDVFSPTLDSPIIENPIPEEEDDAETEKVSTDLPLTPYAAYLVLVQAAEERAATVSSTPVSALSESITMNLAKLDARRAGLRAEEIEAALQIGAYRGRATLPTRQPETESSKAIMPPSEIPILWTSAADMLKRRPDLLPKIETLREDEVEALAALVGEALQEFYWIQLNVVLSLYLDHDLHLTRTVGKLPKSGTLVP